MTSPTQGEHAQTEALPVSDALRTLHEAILNRLSHPELLEKAHYLMELNSNQARTIGELQDLVEAANAQPAAPQGVTYVGPPAECDSPELCAVSRSCAGQYGTQRICASNGQAPAGAADEMAINRPVEDSALPFNQWRGEMQSALKRAGVYAVRSPGAGNKLTLRWRATRDDVLPAPTAQAAPAADYDHGPQSLTVAEAARHVGKWLNERPNSPLDLRDVAMLVAHVQAPADGAVAGPSEAPEGWRNQFAEAVYADLEAADNQDVPLEEYPTRILKALDSIVGPRHPTVIHWRNDAIQACIAIAYKYCRDPESFQYLKQDLQALIFAAPTTQAAPQADSVLEDAARATLFTTPYQRGEMAGDGKPCNNNHDPDCRWPDCICRHREARFDAARKQGAKHDNT